MRIKISVLAAILLLISVERIYAQQTNGYTITGNINSLPEGTVFYLIRTNERGGADTVSKVKSKGGNFSIRGTLQSTPEMHFLKIDTTIAKIPPKTQTWIPILLENTEISLTADLKNWPIVTIEGSLPTIEYNQIGEIIRSKINESNAKVIAATKEIPKDSLKIANLTREALLNVVTILKSYPDAYATPLMASNIKLLDASSQEDIYNGLSDRVKNSLYGARLKKHYSSLKESQQITPGGIMPAFSILAPNGREMNILDEVAKNKITLIDFWASWCKPCRDEVPNMLKVYHAFNKRGFNIIAISSDAKKEAWQKAMEEDNTPWVHGLEKSSYRIAKELFRLQSIPAFALVDKNGKLLAFERGMSPIKAFGPDIRGEELYATIEMLLLEIEKGNNRKASINK